MTQINISLKQSLKEDFSDFIELEGQREKFASLGNYNTEKASIHFFEWSDLTKEKQFDTDAAFFRFLTDSHIWTTYQEDRDIKGLSHIGDGAYVVCKPKTTKLIIKSNLENLTAELDKLKEEADKTPSSSEHNVPAVYPSCCGCYGGYGSYGEGPEYCECYDDW